MIGKLRVTSVGGSYEGGPVVFDPTLCPPAWDHQGDDVAEWRAVILFSLPDQPPRYITAENGHLIETADVRRAALFTAVEAAKVAAEHDGAVIDHPHHKPAAGYDDTANMKAVVGHLASHTAPGVGVPLWHVVGRLTGQGSSVAMRLCRLLGFDPGLYVLKPGWHDPERTAVLGYCQTHQITHPLEGQCIQCATETEAGKEEAFYNTHPEARPSQYADEPGSVGGI